MLYAVRDPSDGSGATALQATQPTCLQQSQQQGSAGPRCDDEVWCMVCRVYVRVKPLSAEEVAVGQSSVLQCQDGHRLQCTALGSTKVKLTGRLVLFTLAPLLWAAWCITRLLITLTPKGVGFSFPWCLPIHSQLPHSAASSALTAASGPLLSCTCKMCCFICVIIQCAQLVLCILVWRRKHWHTE